MKMRIEQLLHGYNNGHTLLSGSIQLKSAKNISYLATFSDWSEYRDPRNEDSSYITSYHLEDTPFYVISKTWYASDMERPGSVWTHSLLVNLEDLDLNFDFRCLLHLFRKPERGKYRDYEFSIVNDDSFISNDICSDMSFTQYMYLYRQILNQNKQLAIKVEMSSDINQKVCLTLMQFLPIDLLKKTSFCSGSSMFRKIGNSEISLQFITAGGESLINMSKNKDLLPNEFSIGLDYIVKSFFLEKQETSALVRLLSSDIDFSYNKLDAISILLFILNNAIKKEINQPEFKNILLFIKASFPRKSEGVKVKDIFLQENISKLLCSEEDFFYTLCTFPEVDSLNFSITSYRSRFARFAASDRHQYQVFLENLSKSECLNREGISILSDSFNLLSSGEINSIIEKKWDLYLKLIMYNDRFLEYTPWLDLSTYQMIDIVVLFHSRPIAISNSVLFFECILKNNIDITDKIKEFVIHEVENPTSIILDFINKQNRNVNVEFLRICFLSISNVTTWIREQSYLSTQVVLIISKYLSPSCLDVKQMDSKSWLLFFSVDDDLLDDDYYVFMFILSFNWVDENSIRYLQRSFYYLHEKLKSNTLASMLWRKLLPFTANLKPWNEWDKCKKLRKGVVVYLKKNGYSKAILKSFTPDIVLNKNLKKSW